MGDTEEIFIDLVQRLEEATVAAESAIIRLREANDNSLTADYIDRLYNAVEKLEEHGWPNVSRR